jgi:hypothetical protein
MAQPPALNSSVAWTDNACQIIWVPAAVMPERARRLVNTGGGHGDHEVPPDFDRLGTK